MATLRALPSLRQLRYLRALAEKCRRPPDMALEPLVRRVPGLVARPLAERRIARRIVLVRRRNAARERDYRLLAGALREALGISEPSTRKENAR